MKFSYVTSARARKSADLVIVPFWKGKTEARYAASIADLEGFLEPLVQAKDFKGKAGGTTLLYPSKKKEKRVLVLGLGEEKSCTVESLRRSYAAAIKRAQNKKWKRINVILPTTKHMSNEDLYLGISEGITLTNYVFEDLKSDDKRELFHIESVAFVGAKKSAKSIVDRVLSINHGVNLTRHLVNGNADQTDPEMLANEAKKLAKLSTRVKTTILDHKAIEREGLGLLLAVSRGGSKDPKLIMVEYRGNPQSKDVTMLVGKGITYDTGGLSIKPTSNMIDMKCDMGGAASVLGTVRAAIAVGLKANFVAVIAATENAIDSKSYKLGDVYKSYEGITVEILNTDAEGRLTLADAISYGRKKFNPTKIIDVATLTGAMEIALGQVRAGFFSTDKKLEKSLMEAGEKTGELLWPLPLDQDLASSLKSQYADVKNMGSRKGSATIAALFIQKFVGKTPWAHLDIAGTAYIDQARDYHMTRATGFGVRLLIELLSKQK